MITVWANHTAPMVAKLDEVGQVGRATGRTSAPQEVVLRAGWEPRSRSTSSVMAMANTPSLNASMRRGAVARYPTALIAFSHPKIMAASARTDGMTPAEPQSRCLFGGCRTARGPRSPAQSWLLSPGVLLVVTIRKDGTPRLSPVAPFVHDGELWL